MSVPPLPSPSRRRRRRRLRRFLTLAAVAVLVIGGGTVALAALRLSQNVTTVELHPAKTDEPPVVADFDGAFDVLLVGSDGRAGQGAQYGEGGDVEGSRNDVTLLLHVNDTHDAATVISFPRDLLVDMPSCTDAETGKTWSAGHRVQFNESLSRGGLGCVASTVTALTGIDLAYAAEISFTGVIDASNAVGGVPICFAGPIHDPHSGLEIPEAGTYDLSGEQALALLRSRYGVGDGSDLARISTQQVFLSSLVRTLRDQSTLTDPVKLYGIADAATRNMTLSTPLADLGTLASMAKVFSDLPLENIAFVSYPHLPAGDRVVPDEQSAAALMERVLSGETVNISADHTGRGSELSAPATPPSADADEPDTAQPETTQPETAQPEPDLPSNIDGQSAAQDTCVRPNSG
ncbi:putative transcriptional regulator YwtF [Microbacterium oxydans]|uniref:Putative transcriptional regulator YwtF n=1 Tax=Microbacterium oxydans TaxID=82380 RepID=A0A0F0KJX3_9MICO|nr:LCP family protein [Microbacterium oxydans]KJL20455.1 putative transcriptional regulator YwtF [Microbacterium oxydans]